MRNQRAERKGCGILEGEVATGARRLSTSTGDVAHW